MMLMMTIVMLMITIIMLMVEILLIFVAAKYYLLVDVPLFAFSMINSGQQLLVSISQCMNSFILIAFVLLFIIVVLRNVASS